MRLLKELRGNVFMLEGEVAEQVENFEKEFSRVLSGKDGSIQYLLDAMLLLRTFGDEDDFLDIVARYPEYLEHIHQHIDEWKHRLYPLNTLKDSLLGYEIKEWAYRDDDPYPYYRLPEEEVHARLDLLADIGIHLQDEKRELRVEVGHAPYKPLRMKMTA